MARDYYEGTKGAASVTEEYNIYKNLNTFDAGISVDIQYTLEKGEGISINVKYIQGFVSPYKAGVNPPALTSFVNIGVGIPVKSRKKEDVVKKG